MNYNVQSWTVILIITTTPTGLVPPPRRTSTATAPRTTCTVPPPPRPRLPRAGTSPRRRRPLRPAPRPRRWSQDRRFVLLVAFIASAVGHKIKKMRPSIVNVQYRSSGLGLYNEYDNIARQPSEPINVRGRLLRDIG